jgi:hypothetical protein
MSVYGTDNPYIGRSVRFRSVRSLKQLKVRIFRKKPVDRTNCPYFPSQKPYFFVKSIRKTYENYKTNLKNCTKNILNSYPRC